MVRFAEAAASLAVAPCTYHSLYEGVDWASRQVDLASIFKMFAVGEEGTGISGADLYDKVKRTGDEMPHAYLTVVKERSPLVFYHRALVFPVPMGVTDAKEWNDKMLMFKMDVVGDQLPQLVQLPSLAFNVVTGASKVHSWRHYVTQYMSPAGEQGPVEAVPDDAPETAYDKVKTRHGMYVPPKLAAMLCQEPDMSVGKVILLVDSLLQELPAEHRDDWDPLLDWLRVLATEGERTKVERSTLPHRVLMDHELVNRLKLVVNSDLPGWGPRPAPVLNDPAPTVNEPNSQLLRLVTEFLAGQQAVGRVEADGEALKKPSSKWKLTLGTLLSLTRCENEGQLPELYSSMANAGKAEKLAVLQALFDQAASELNYEVPLATAEIWSTFEKLEFKAPNDFYPERGVNPYLVLVASERLIHARRQVEEQQVLLEGGSNAAQLSDVRELWNSKTVAFPTTDKYTRKTLEAFAVLLVVAVGRDSSLFRKYRQEIVEGWRDVEDRLLDMDKELGNRGLIYNKYLLAIRSELQDYWSRCLKNPTGHVDLPEFSSLQSDIRRWRWTPPSLPAAFSPATSPRSNAGATASGTVASSSSSRGGSAARAGGQARSPGGDPEVQEIEQRQVENPSPDEELLGLGRTIGKIRVFMRRIAPRGAFIAAFPRLTNGKECCLSWHTKGSCYPTCNRIATHTALSPQDRESLVNFLNVGIALRAERESAQQGNNARAVSPGGSA